MLVGRFQNYFFMKKSSLLKDLGLLLLRVSFAGAMLTHGWPKLQKLIAGGEIEFFDFLGLGNAATLVLTVLGEFVIPVILIVGFKTRIAALPAAFTMAVAFFYVHAADPFGDKEMAFLYFIAFTAIALLGGGKFSVDGVLASKKRRS